MPGLVAAMSNGAAPAVPTADEAADLETAPAEVVAASPLRDLALSAQAAVAEPPPLAEVEGLVVHLPTAEPVVVGYHEASRDAALELTPIGVLAGNHNATKFSPPADDDAGLPYLVLSSRGRVMPATSSVDIVMVDDDPVLSPVTGTVTDVRRYDLYDQHEDHRVEIAPDEVPGLRVVVVHLDGLAVSEGDRVVAGESVLAPGARRFPFSSQVDRETEPDRWPHVHLEVKWEDAPRPGDEGWDG